MKRLLRACEIDLEYAVKDKFLNALVATYGIKQMGLGDPLFHRDQIEEALMKHAEAGRPTVQAMVSELKRKSRRTEQNAERVKS